MNRVPIRRFFLRVFALVATIFFCLSALSAQQKDKKKKDKQPPKVENSSANPVIPLTDEQQLDYMISELLGAWQIGDVDRMHKYYTEDVSVVNGGWAPPILGWANYEALYKQQRATMKQVRMDRTNSYIKVSGNCAWAAFQWDFSALVNDSPAAARGQTTYIFVKKDNHWLIAHDHTSVVQSSQPQPSNPPGAVPGKPAN
jgi:ketosteroid isomerase-like protein